VGPVVVFGDAPSSWLRRTRPEHSSGRLERFLTLSARNNIRVAQPTTSAQYFHLLRSQVLRSHPTPLVVFTPKSMLRAVQTRSALVEFEQGSFRSVLDDALDDPSLVTRAVLASGKVAHEAITRRNETGTTTIAIIRVEQLYPWREPRSMRRCRAIRISRRSSGCKKSREHGSVALRPLADAFAVPRHDVGHVARAESASPATGSGLIHNAEQADLFTRALG